MRMLFYTAAAIAATLAAVGDALKINQQGYSDEALLNMKESMFPELTDNEFLDLLEQMDSYRAGTAGQKKPTPKQSAAQGAAKAGDGYEADARMPRVSLDGQS